MIKSYFIIAWRNLMRNKAYSIINILGLSLGMAAFFFIFQYVSFEKSYDRFNVHAPDIYRVALSYGGSLTDAAPSATNHPALGPAMKRDLPEVVAVVRMLSLTNFTKSNFMVQQEGDQKKAFYDNALYWVDSNFFKVFSYPLLRGDKNTCLSEAHSVVISATMAKRYFGKQDPMNKILLGNGLFPMKVTGVFADVPENSHLQFSALAPLAPSLREWGSADKWTWPVCYTYVQLAPHTDPEKLAAKFPSFIDKYLGTVMKEMNFRSYFHLQPLTDIHLRSHYINEAAVNGDENEVFFLSLIGVFILLIAWTNYINLSTAKSMERAKEVGIRKVSGALKKHLVLQFLVESLIVNCLALLMTDIIVTATMPLFDALVGKNISTIFFTQGLGSHGSFWCWVGVFFLAASLLVGAYPAFVLSSFNPVRVLKGLIIKSTSRLSLRRALLSLQFFLSIMLIAATLVVFAQLNFMRKGALGYAKDQLLVIRIASALTDSTHAARLTYFKQEVLRQFSAVRHMSFSADVPGSFIKDKRDIRLAGLDRQHSFSSFYCQVDHDFMTTYQVPLLAGSNLTQQDSSETLNHGGSGMMAVDKNLNVLVNEALAKSLGFASARAAVNQQIIIPAGGGEFYARIKGVVKNFHQRSLKEGYEPILFAYPSYNNWGWDNVSLQINTAQLGSNLPGIESLFKKVFPGKPFESFFLDEFFDRQYRTDQRLGKVFALFAALAVIVACLGLLGLSAFVIKLRLKEIGIRKVLGATVASVLVLVSKDFIKLVCLAAVVALPVAYWAASAWLRHFAFHISLGLGLFVVPPLLLLLLVLLTVCLQSLRAAMANPVKTLRTE